MNEAKDYSTEETSAGLEDALATIAEIWRNSLDDSIRKRCIRALAAIHNAQDTMNAADSLLMAKTRKQRADAMEAIRKAAIFRVKDGERRTYP